MNHKEIVLSVLYATGIDYRGLPLFQIQDILDFEYSLYILSLHNLVAFSGFPLPVVMYPSSFLQLKMTITCRKLQFGCTTFFIDN